MVVGKSLRSSLRIGGLGAALSLAVLSSVTEAHADPESDAKDLFARARDLRTKNDCAAAVPLFRKAYVVYPNGLGSLRNVAECEEQLGHYASAKRAWLDIKRALITMKQDPKYDGWDHEAVEAATRLQPKVATVYVDVTLKTPTSEGLANDKSGVELIMNGETMGATLVGTPLDRDPGQYHIRVQAPYAAAVEGDVVLAAGDVKHVALKVLQTPPEKTAEPPPATTDTGKTKRTAGFVLMGVGGASLIASLITFLSRNSAKSDLDTQCPTHTGCSTSLTDTVNRGKTMSTLTDVFFPVGLVAAGAGVGLFLWGNSEKNSTAPTTGLLLTPAPGGASATWRF